MRDRDVRKVEMYTMDHQSKCVLDEKDNIVTATFVSHARKQKKNT